MITETKFKSETSRGESKREGGRREGGGEGGGGGGAGEREREREREKGGGGAEEGKEGERFLLPRQSIVNNRMLVLVRNSVVICVGVRSKTMDCIN